MAPTEQHPTSRSPTNTSGDLFKEPDFDMEAQRPFGHSPLPSDDLITKLADKLFSMHHNSHNDSNNEDDCESTNVDTLGNKRSPFTAEARKQHLRNLNHSSTANDDATLADTDKDTGAQPAAAAGGDAKSKSWLSRFLDRLLDKIADFVVEVWSDVPDCGEDPERGLLVQSRKQ